MDDPQLVIMAKLEDPKGAVYGGLTAAPVSRAVVQAILATRGRGLIETGAGAHSRARLEWSEGEATPSPFQFAAARDLPQSAATERNQVLPDMKGLETRVAAARLHELGLRVELQGSGRVTRQEPAAGTRVVRGATILLR